MGCSLSKLDSEEAVQICKDRKKFIKQAVEHRMKFASTHITYMQAMKRVSAALRDYIDGDEPRELPLDSFTTPIKKRKPRFISISPNSFSVTPIKSETKSSYKINYYISGGNSSVLVEERPPHSPQTHRVEAYSPICNFGIDSVSSLQSSSFFENSPNIRPNNPSPSPSLQTSQWDFFLDPFSSLDYFGYPMRDSLDQLGDEKAGLKEVREEETKYEDIDEKMSDKEDNGNLNIEHVVAEDVSGSDSDNDVESPSKEDEPIEVAKAQNTLQLSKKETDLSDGESKEETPGFTVYVNRRPTNMAEVIKDIEDQFTAACNAAGEVSSISDSTITRCSSSINDVTAMKILNPLALLRSASSRLASSTFFGSDSTSKDEGYESSSDFSEESCMFSSSHQLTLGQLYAWEKKLYNEVRAGARVRIAYEKKIAQLRNRDSKGEDPSFVDKTRVAIRDLHTQIKVSTHSVEAISKRIETLRDEELEPQVLELVQELARMWKTMAECHQFQRRTLDEAKVLLGGKHTIMSPSSANLVTELKNWSSSFEAWIVSQRSYVNALTAWLLRCVPSDDAALRFPFSLGGGAPAMFNVCIQWSRFLETICEARVVDGIDYFANGIGSLRLKERQDEVMTAELTAEVAVRVLCAGMSVAVSAVTEFSVNSAEGYADLVKQWENKQ